MEYDGIVIGLMIRHDARWSYVREGRNTAHLVTPEADKDQYFLLSPNLDVTERSSSPSARDLRKCIKSTKSPGELLAVLKHAAEEVAVEQDTLGTAMQTCGHRMWWDALLEVFEMKKQAAFANSVYKHRFQCLGVLFEVWRRESFCLPAVAKEGDCGGPGKEGSLHWEGKTWIYWLRLSTCTGEQVVGSNWIMSCVHMKQSGVQDSFWH